MAELENRYCSELKCYIHESLSKVASYQHASKSSALTVGIEQEFFLLSTSGNPVTHEEGQAFLESLARIPNWYIREKQESELGVMISRVSLEGPCETFTAVKYDHHPHLFEIAFGYRKDLGAMERLLVLVFSGLQEAAFKTNLKISAIPVLELQGNDHRVTSPLSAFKNLRHYRRKILESRNEVPNSNAVNYAALIAATQVHIGQSRWWEAPDLIGRLYGYEADILDLQFREPKKAGEANWNSMIQKRWNGYTSVFSGYPLVGFPRMSGWSVESWVHALIRSPLAGGAKESWAGSTLLELEGFPFSGWTDFFKSVRDLQIIRPRLFGTLEFRADPAQPNIEGILASAALRLGVCSNLIGNESAGLDFKFSQQRWWDIIRGIEHSTTEPSVIEVALKGLQARGYGEEKYLPVYTSRKCIGAPNVS